MIFRASCFAGVFLFSLLLAHGDAIDDYVRDQMDVRDIPGISVAVVKDGALVRAKGYGMANVELAAPATEHTVYQLASVTKQFTATAAMMLVEESKLSLDARITEMLEDLPSAWSNVTVRHLLNHTSGIKSYTGTPDFFKAARKDFEKKEILGLVAHLPMEFEPGEDWKYNNTGYFLLGMVIEKASGQAYGDFVKSRIFDKTGMTTARLNDMTEIIPNRARGYSRQKGRLVNGEYVSPTQPYSAGALVGSVLDLAKWDTALDSDALLKRATFEEMWSPTRLGNGRTQNYGFGWTVDTYRTRKRVQHGGGIPGFSTFIARYIDDHVTVIVLANSDAAQSEVIANGIAELYIPALAENAPKPVADDDPEITEHLKSILKTMAGGTGKPEWFTPEAQGFFFPDRIKEGRDMFGVHGDLKSFELMENRTEDMARVRGYKATFGKNRLRITFRLVDDNRISTLNVRPE